MNHSEICNLFQNLCQTKPICVQILIINLYFFVYLVYNKKSLIILNVKN